MKWQRWLALALVTAGVLAAGGCSLWGPEGGPGGTGIVAGPTPSATVVDAVAGADGVQRIDIEVGDDLRFHPSSVRAHPGVVEITFHNTGATPHDVQFDPGGVSTGNFNGGATVVVRVTADQPGVYPFPCVYHVSSGMTGTLEIA